MPSNIDTSVPREGAARTAEVRQNFSVAKAEIEALQQADAALAAVATSGSYNDLLNTPSLASVATTGSYNDLVNRPVLAGVATSGSYNDLLNKPSLGSAAALDHGVGPNLVVTLDSAGKLPGVDGSQLTGVVSDGLPTGATIAYAGATAPAGWLLCDGSTIGSAGSAASHADATLQALFELLWSGHADAELPVSGGRGASATADWTANKTITLPDLRGRVVVGHDSMGGTAAGRVTLAGSGVDGGTMGAAGGAETHVLTEAEMPSHRHVKAGAYRDGGSANANPSMWARVNASESPTTLHTGFAGGDQAHQNMPPSWVMNRLIKT